MLETSVQGVTAREVMYGDQPAQLITLDDHQLIRRTAAHNRFAVLPRKPAELAKLPLLMHTMRTVDPPTTSECTLLRALLGPAGRRVYRYIAGHAYRLTEWGGATAELYVFLGLGQVVNTHLDELNERLRTDIWCWVGGVESWSGRAEGVLTVNPAVLDDPWRGVAAHRTLRPNGSLHDCGRVLSRGWADAYPVSVDGDVLVNLGPPMTVEQALATMTLTKGVGT